MSDADQVGAERRKGRPAGKRGTFTFRVTPELRARLEAAAAAVERPVSEEIERRLERSFEDVDLLLSYFGSSETLKLAHAVARIARTVEINCGRDWSKDSATKNEFKGALDRFFELYFYEQDDAVPTGGAPVTLELLGRGHAAAEAVARDLGLKSKSRDDMDAFLATPEARAALERYFAGKPQSDASAPKKD